MSEFIYPFVTMATLMTTVVLSVYYYADIYIIRLIIYNYYYYITDLGFKSILQFVSNVVCFVDLGHNTLYRKMSNRK